MLDTVLMCGVVIVVTSLSWLEWRCWRRMSTFHLKDAWILPLEWSIWSKGNRNGNFSRLFFLIHIYSLCNLCIRNIIPLQVFWLFDKLFKQIRRILMIDDVDWRLLLCCIFVGYWPNWPQDLVGHRWINAHCSFAEAELHFFVLVPGWVEDVPRADCWPYWVHHDVLVFREVVQGHWVTFVPDKTNALVDTPGVLLEVLVLRRFSVQIYDHLLEGINAFLPLLQEFRVVNGDIQLRTLLVKTFSRVYMLVLNVEYWCFLMPFREPRHVVRVS